MINSNRILQSVRILQNIFFFVPVLVIFARSIGISLGELLLVEAFFTLLITFIDLPLGHITDKLSAKYALALGMAFQALACFLLYFFPNPSVFWGTQILFALAMGLTRGSDSALNLALLRDHSQEHDFIKSEKQYMSLLLGFEALSFFLGGYMASLDLKLPFLFTGVTQILSLFLMLLIKNLKTETESQLNWSQKYHYLKESLSSTQSHRFLILTVVFMGIGLTALLYLAPLVMEKSNLNLTEIGSLFAFASLTAALLSWVLKNWHIKILWLILLGFLGFLGFLSSQSLIIAGSFTLIKMIQTELYPLIKNQLIKTFPQLGYVTTFSFFTTLLSLGFALFSPFLGYLGEKLGIHFLIGACMGFFILGGFCYIFAMNDFQSRKTQ